MRAWLMKRNVVELILLVGVMNFGLKWIVALLAEEEFLLVKESISSTVFGIIFGGFFFYVIKIQKEKDKTVWIRMDHGVQVYTARTNPQGLGQAVRYIHGVWGDESNYEFYSDSIMHSEKSRNQLPVFFVLMKEDRIIGCAALLTMDFISRQDLFPWLACLFVDEAERGHGYGQLLMSQVEQRAREAGFQQVYLTSSHNGYYEKYGWERIEDGIYLFGGQPSRIYQKKLD